MQQSRIYGDQAEFREIIGKIRRGEIKKIVVVAGAGLSTAAGIPDFRSENGLYARLGAFSLPYPEAMFSLSYYRYCPRALNTLLRWLWCDTRFDKFVPYHPTKGHAFLRMLQDKGILHRVFTQNIDGLEVTAGLSKQVSVECHGHIRSAHCAGTSSCNQRVPLVSIRAAVDDRAGFSDGIVDHEAFHMAHIVSSEYADGALEILRSQAGVGIDTPQMTFDQLTYSDSVPVCSRCACPSKPDIVFFGEDLPERYYQEKDEAENADLLIVIGSSLQVEPVSKIPDSVSAPRILINRDLVGDFCCLAADVERGAAMDLSGLLSADSAVHAPDVVTQKTSQEQYGAPRPPSDGPFEQHSESSSQTGMYGYNSSDDATFSGFSESDEAQFDNALPQYQQQGQCDKRCFFIQGDVDQSCSLLASLLGMSDDFRAVQEQITSEISQRAVAECVKHSPEDQVLREFGDGDIYRTSPTNSLRSLEYSCATTFNINRAAAGQMAQTGWLIALTDSPSLLPYDATTTLGRFTPREKLHHATRELEHMHDLRSRTATAMVQTGLEEQSVLPFVQCLKDGELPFTEISVGCVAMSRIQFGRFTRFSGQKHSVRMAKVIDALRTRFHVSPEDISSWHLDQPQMDSEYLTEGIPHYLFGHKAPGFSRSWLSELQDRYIVQEYSVVIDFCSLVEALGIDVTEVIDRIREEDSGETVPLTELFPLRTVDGNAVVDCEESQLLGSASGVIKRLQSCFMAIEESEDQLGNGPLIAHLVSLAQNSAAFLELRHGVSVSDVVASLPLYMQKLIVIGEAASVLMDPSPRIGAAARVYALIALFRLTNSPWWPLMNGDEKAHGCLVLQVPLITDTLRSRLEDLILRARKRAEVADIDALSAALLAPMGAEASHWPNSLNCFAAEAPLYRPPFGHWAASFFGYYRQASGVDRACEDDTVPGTQSARIASLVSDRAAFECIFTRHLGLDFSAAAEQYLNFKGEGELLYDPGSSSPASYTSKLRSFFEPAGVSVKPTAVDDIQRHQGELGLRDMAAVSCGSGCLWKNPKQARLFLEAEIGAIASSVLHTRVNVRVHMYGHQEGASLPGLGWITIEWQSPSYYDYPCMCSPRELYFADSIRQIPISKRFDLHTPPIMSAAEVIITYILRTVLEGTPSIFATLTREQREALTLSKKQLPWAVPDSVVLTNLDFEIERYNDLYARMRSSIKEYAAAPVEAAQLRAPLPAWWTEDIESRGQLSKTDAANGAVVPSPAEELRLWIAGEPGTIPASQVISLCHIDKDCNTNVGAPRLIYNSLISLLTGGHPVPKTGIPSHQFDRSLLYSAPFSSSALIRFIILPVSAIRSLQLLIDSEEGGRILSVARAIVDNPFLPVVIMQYLRNYYESERLIHEEQGVQDRRTFMQWLQTRSLWSGMTLDESRVLSRRLSGEAQASMFVLDACTTIIKLAGEYGDNSVKDDLAAAERRFNLAKNLASSQPLGLQKAVDFVESMGQSQQLPDNLLWVHGAQENSPMGIIQTTLYTWAHEQAYYRIMADHLFAMKFIMEQLHRRLTAYLLTEVPEAMRLLLEQTWISYESDVLHQLSVNRLLTEISGPWKDGPRAERIRSELDPCIPVEQQTGFSSFKGLSEATREELSQQHR